MSWSPGEYALTQTATEVPLAELALSELKLSVAWGLRLNRLSGLRLPYVSSKVPVPRNSRLSCISTVLPAALGDALSVQVLPGARTLDAITVWRTSPGSHS